jgi:hypothetical protein
MDSFIVPRYFIGVNAARVGSYDPISSEMHAEQHDCVSPTIRTDVKLHDGVGGWNDERGIWDEVGHISIGR